MGMELIGRRLSGDELRAVLDAPATVDVLLYGDLGDDDAEMPEPELDLGKYWHAIHYLLTGTAWETGGSAAGAATSAVTLSARTAVTGRPGYSARRL